MAAQPALVEAADPDRVPQHDLLRERRLRRPAGGKGLLRRGRRRADPPPGRAARRDPGRPDRVRPRAASGRGAGARARPCSPRCGASNSSPRARNARRTARRCRIPTTSAWAARRARRRTSATTSSSSSSTRSARAACTARVSACRRPSTSASRSWREGGLESAPEPGRPGRGAGRDRPDTGNVLAMVGGRNYSKSQFNLAVQSRRQPGSSFKPFVLASALEDGISPATHFESSRSRSSSATSTGRRRTTRTSTSATSTSSARPSTRTTSSTRSSRTSSARRAVARTARRLGVRSPLHPVYSIGLGTQAVNPLEMARALLRVRERRLPHRHAHVRQPPARGRPGADAVREVPRATTRWRARCSARARPPG